MKWIERESVSSDIKLQILHNRNLVTDAQIEQFFAPNLEADLAQIEFPDMDIAVTEIKKRIENKKKIIIYGDYDCDGVSAAAIVYRGLISLGAVVKPFIPHRDRDGYGLSVTGINQIRDEHPDTDLVITVDNGVVAIEEVKYAKSLGLSMIITDHHEPLETRPDALAIIHSTKLCGATVAWCLISKLVDPALAQRLLQLGCIGTICDAMPLIGVGRSFAIEGIKQIQTAPFAGIFSLSLGASIEVEKMNSYEIGHMIGPRLNASGRLDSALPSLRLLCFDSINQTNQIAKTLNQLNVDRQNLTLEALELAKTQIRNEDKINVVYSSEFRSGIIGLIAARLVDETNKPSIAISVAEDVAKGSARSVEDVHITEVLRTCSDLMLGVGGHSGAAGFSLVPENIPALRARLQQIEYTPSEKSIDIEMRLKYDQVNMELLKLVNLFEPFGQGNPPPNFVANFRIDNIKTVGDGRHLKLTLNGISAIGFGMGEVAKDLSVNQRLDVVFNIDRDNFNGRNSFQLRLKDLKI